jgi:hypothetical protein
MKDNKTALQFTKHGNRRVIERKITDDEIRKVLKEGKVTKCDVISHSNVKNKGSVYQKIHTYFDTTNFVALFVVFNNDGHIITAYKNVYKEVEIKENLSDHKNQIIDIMRNGEVSVKANHKERYFTWWKDGMRVRGAEYDTKNIEFNIIITKYEEDRWKDDIQKYYISEWNKLEKEIFSVVFGNNIE